MWNMPRMQGLLLSYMWLLWSKEWGRYNKTRVRNSSPEQILRLLAQTIKLKLMLWNLFSLTFQNPTIFAKVLIYKSTISETSLYVHDKSRVQERNKDKLWRPLPRESFLPTTFSCQQIWNLLKQIRVTSF